MSQANLSGSVAGTATPLVSSATGVAGAATGGVRGAIARAAQATGVDFSYLLAQAKLESSLDPKARASTSSATGLYQFTKGTWGTMLARHGASLGLDATGNAAGLPTSRAQLMALRNDPNSAAMMAAELAGDNTTALTGALGRAPTSSELYLAHFLGTGGATRFLSALATDPTQSAAALLPKAASANRAVFFDPGGAPRSVGEVMTLIQTRMDTAMQDVSGANVGSFAMAGQTGMAPLAQQFAQTQTTTGDAAQTTTEPVPTDTGGDATSMADTLRNTFALSGDSPGTAPAFVRSAYGRLQAFGL